MAVLDFLWGYAWILVFWTGFDFNGKTAFPNSDTDTKTSWSDVRLVDSWAATLFFSLPHSARKIVDIQPFSHSFSGKARRCIQAALECLLPSDRSYSRLLALPAMDSNFQKTELATIALTEVELRDYPMMELLDFFETAVSWVGLCHSQLRFDNGAMLHPLRVTNFGAPHWSTRVQGILHAKASPSLLNAWGILPNNLDAGRTMPDMTASRVDILRPGPPGVGLPPGVGPPPPVVVLDPIEPIDPWEPDPAPAQLPAGPSAFRPSGPAPFMPWIPGVTGAGTSAAGTPLGPFADPNFRPSWSSQNN
jgi:hypothetical protein